MGKGGKSTQSTSNQDNRILNELEDSTQLNLESNGAGGVTVSMRDDLATETMGNVITQALDFVGGVLTKTQQNQEELIASTTALSSNAVNNLADNKTDQTSKTIMTLAGIAVAGYVLVKSKIIK